MIRSTRVCMRMLKAQISVAKHVEEEELDNP